MKKRHTRLLATLAIISLTVSSCLTPQDGSVGGGPGESTPPDSAPDAETTTTSVAGNDDTTATEVKPAAECDVIAIEAETLELSGSWSVEADEGASGGQYITWQGLEFEANSNTPEDVLSTTIAITKPGTYNFVWAMRQPGDVESDKANDSFLHFPDATRFGPADGGDFGDFVKVFGQSKDGFAYTATAEQDDFKGNFVVEFDEAGEYTMQIGGRSHGHQIDRIVLYESSLDKDEAVAGDACKNGETLPEAPEPSPATETSGPFDPTSDLISLHYDHAPDKDDGHATVAGLEVSTTVGFEPLVVGGAYGALNASTYNADSEEVMDATWGPGGWIDAHNNRDGAVDTLITTWAATLDGGGDVWVAEGGQSDLTFDVASRLADDGYDVKRIHVVQHSHGSNGGFNETNTSDEAVAFLESQMDYIRIDNGNNGGNDTANFNQQDPDFVAAALAGPHSQAWEAAFAYFDPVSEKLDFSDTVELMYILGYSVDEVSDPDDFAATFIASEKL